MKGPREKKRYIAILRSLASKRKKNGVIPGAWMDDLLIFKFERCKKWRRHKTG
jgi:hypothetical protein